MVMWEVYAEQDPVCHVSGCERICGGGAPLTLPGAVVSLDGRPELISWGSTSAVCAIASFCTCLQA